MAFSATALPVMIASPGDVPAERQIVEQVIHEWNAVYAAGQGVVLLPVRWESHSAPDLSGRPQALINERVLDRCDILIGIFWTRLGSSTGTAASGTVEEIDRHTASGKLAMIYFSDKPAAPSLIESLQAEKLADFKKSCRDRGLYEGFTSEQELHSKLTHQLPINLTANPYISNLIGAAVSNEDFIAAPILSADARELLKAAVSDGDDGLILRVPMMAGLNIQAGGRNFGGRGREEARWDGALNELLRVRAIERSGQQAFKVTREGYALADGGVR